MNPVRVVIIVFLFTGLAGNTFLLQSQTLNIGLLIPDRHSEEPIQGAELAIRDANRQGGYKGEPFHLVVKSVEGLWGVGSKQSVHLIFEDRVLAIAGSLDGRNAHLAEQVTTKTKVPFLSTRATDMTLSYAFVPWYFRCIPDDKQQASVLIREIKEPDNIVLIGSDSYDARQAIATFKKLAATNNISPPPRTFFFKPPYPELEKTLSMLNKQQAGAFVLFGESSLAARFFTFYRRQGLKQPVFGNLSLLYETKPQTYSSIFPGDIILVSSDLWFTKKGKDFQKRFLEAYGHLPGIAAAYAYDGINVIIRAVKAAGPDHDRIIEVLSKIKYEGVTGTIRFDNKGNLGSPGSLMIMKKGIPSLLPDD